MAKIEISDELMKAVREAISKGACCSTEHYIERAVQKDLKAKTK